MLCGEYENTMYLILSIRPTKLSSPHPHENSQLGDKMFLESTGDIAFPGASLEPQLGNQCLGQWQPVNQYQPLTSGFSFQPIRRGG